MNFRSSYLILVLFCISNISYSQVHSDTASTFAQNILNKERLFLIGISGSPNFTFVGKSNFNNSVYPAPVINSRTGYGLCVTAKVLFPEGIFFCSGLSFQKQSYQLNQQGGTDSVPPFNFSSPPTLNNDNYKLLTSSYYIGLPIAFGFRSHKNAWAYYASVGLEFYYNCANSASMYDVTKNELIYQQTFYKRTWIAGAGYLPFSLLQTFYRPLNVFGTLACGVSYNFNSKLSAIFEPILRFTNPVSPIVVGGQFTSISGLANLSLNIGLSYSLDINDEGSFRKIDKEKEVKRIIIGFHWLPNYLVSPQLPFFNNKSVGFSYAFTAQFNFSTRLGLETGIVIDNFNTDDVGWSSIGIPVMLKYYIPEKTESIHSFFIGAGLHLTYPIYFSSPSILPITQIEVGYEIKLGQNYFFNMAIGYENWLPYIFLNDNNANASSDLPSDLFTSFGMGYRL